MLALHRHGHAETEHARSHHAEYGEAREHPYGGLRIVAQRGSEEHDSHQQIHHRRDEQERHGKRRRAQHAQGFVFGFRQISVEYPAVHEASCVSSMKASASPARRTSNSSKCSSAANRRLTTSSALLAVMCNWRRSRSTLSTPGQLPTSPAESALAQLMRFRPTTARISPTVPDAIERPLASTTTRSASASASSR